MAFHDYRVAKLVARGQPIEPEGDEFLSITLPAQFSMGDTIGDGPRPIELSSDRSAEITCSIGERTKAHANLSKAWLAQSVAVGSGSRVGVLGDYVAVLTNGDVVVGRGVLERPTDLGAGTSSGSRAWVVKLQEASYAPNPAQLLAELAIDGGL